jgi:hypothetical protein
MQLVRDLLDQALRDPEGEPAGRADDFLLVAEDDGIFVAAILSGGGIVADDLGWIGRACESIVRVVRRRPLRRSSIPWSDVSEVAEHALTVPGGRRGARVPAGVRLRAARRLPVQSADGVRLHLIDLQVVDPRPRTRLRVAGLIVRPRSRVAWPVSLRPRQRGAAGDWRFVPVSHVGLSHEALVVDSAFAKLKPVGDNAATRPPKRKPRTDA